MKPPAQPKKNLPVLVVLAAALVLVIVNPSDPRDANRNQLVNTATRGIIPQITKDTQLLIYKKISDSLEKIIRWKKERVTQTGTSTYFLFTGINRIDECDSCIDVNEKSRSRKHFISFNGFALRHGAYFLIDRNEYIIEKFVAEKKTERSEMGHMERKKIDVRLGDGVHDGKGLTLLIPVSKGLFTWIEIIMHILLGLAIIISIWLFIVLPFRVLVNIANGKPFLEKNIKYLQWTGWGIISACLAMVILPKLVQWIFALPAEIYYPFWSSLFDNRWGLSLGVAVLITARAFKQGYQLQQEQDLTI